MKTVDTNALCYLKAYRGKLTPQQYKTLRGQILAGDAQGAKRGLMKILRGTRNEGT